MQDHGGKRGAGMAAIRWSALLPPLALAGLWLLLVWLLGRFSFGDGPLIFVCLVGLAGLAACAPAFLRRWGMVRPPARPPWLVAALLALALLVAVAGRASQFQAAWEHPRYQTWAVDVAINTYVAGDAMRQGFNPYSVRAQRWYRMQPGPHVEVAKNGAVTMFGLPYAYGYPYWPAMALSYLPFRELEDGIRCVRLGNAFFLNLQLLGVLLLAARLAGAGAARWLAAPLAGLLCVGPSCLGPELFELAVTDVALATWALWAFVALAWRRSFLAGALLGVAQACKLLPGPLLLLAALLWLSSRRQRLQLLAGWLLLAGLLVLPWALWQPSHFVSATALFYLTHHAAGDDSSLWYFLPPLLQTPFRICGLALVGWIVWRARAVRSLAALAGLGFAAYAVFSAFNNMSHLNYLWGVYPLGCVALAVGIFASPSDERAPQCARTQ